MYTLRLSTLAVLVCAAMALCAQTTNDNDSISARDSILNEVVIRPTRIKMVHKNDTIVFDASAFDLPEGSMLDALIRQMPGAKLSDDGVITINGRKVDYLLLNGKDFFMGNNKAMLDNLPHYAVRNIRVYERETDKSQHMGRSIEAREYVMDVSLKQKRNYLANAEAGIATAERYMARGFGSRVTKNSALSAYLNFNNINETRRPDSSGEWMPENAPTGKRTTNDIGVDFTVDNERYKNILGVNGKLTDNEEASDSRSNRFNSTGQFYQLRDAYSNDKTKNLSFNNTFQLKAPFWMELASSLQAWHHESSGRSREAILHREITEDKGNKELLDSIFSQMPALTLQQMLVNRHSFQHFNTAEDISLFQRICTNHKLPWGDNIEFEANGTYGKAKFENHHDYRLDYFSSPQQPDYRNQYFNNPTDNHKWEVRGEYYRNFSKAWTARIYTLYSQSKANNDNSAYRIGETLQATYSPKESAYSRHTTRTSQSGLHISYDRRTDSTSRTLRFHLPLYVQKEQLHYWHNSQQQDAARTATYINGEVSFNAWWNNWRRCVNASLSHTTDLPSMQNLITIPDERNPLNIRLGNPSLKRSHRYNASLYYYHVSENQRWNAYGQVTGMYKATPINHGFNYNPQTGVYTYQDVNGDRFLMGNVMGGVNAYLDKKQAWQLGYTTFVQRNKGKNTEILNNQNGLTAYDIGLTYTMHNLELKYNRKRLNSSFTSQYVFQNVGYGAPVGTNYKTHTYTLRHNIQYTIPLLELQLSNQLSWHYNRNDLQGMPDQSNVIWNVYASRSFLKDKSMMLKFSAFDILGNLSQHYVNVVDQGFVIGTNKRLAQYFMLSVAWQLKSKSS